MASSTATEPLTDDQQLSTELQTHATITDLAATSLLDLPAPCIHRITRKLRNKQLVSLCQSCRTLMREGLTDRDVTVTVQLHEAGAEHRTRSLRLACQHAKSVHLVLSGAASGPQAELAAPAEGAAGTAKAYLAHAVAALGHTLDKVTKVTMQGMTSAELVPSWLTASCPQLTSLRHANNIHLSPPSSDDPPSNTTLTQLTFPSPESASAGIDVYLTIKYNRQLSALKNLTDVTVTGTMGGNIMLSLFGACPGVSRLRLPDELGTDPFAWELYKGAVVQLEVPQMQVTDDMLARLKKLPALQQLSCQRMDLLFNHSDEACNLTRLTVRHVGCMGLARLPLHQLESLTAARDPGLGYCICPSGNPADNSKVLSEVQRTGGLKWGDQQPAPQRPVVSIVLPEGTPDAAECMAFCVQLLASYSPPPRQSVMFVVTGPVTVAALQILRPLLRQRKQPYLTVTPSGPDVALLSALLPATSSCAIVTVNIPTITESQLLQLLCPCPRPVIVGVIGLVTADNGWQQRVEAAAKAAVTQAAKDGVVSTARWSPEEWAERCWVEVQGHTVTLFTGSSKNTP